MKYTISYNNPYSQYIDVELQITNIKQNKLTLQLPAWRPGRYELGNFAKNIQKWNAFDSKGNTLNSWKVTKNSWEISTENVEEVFIKYNYYASELNAGSSFLDDQQLYVNPVNCCLYVPERINEECTLEVKVPSDYKIAIGLKKITEQVFQASNFHELADNPFIASKSLIHHKFIVESVDFHLWFQGECKPNMERITKDFTAFIKEQVNMMGEFPVSVYHFLFQLMPSPFHHGVEHTTSTVIALGPAYNLMKKEQLYDEFLQISSHELFHVWNIKSIRPIEMMPYDYTQENYSNLGFVAEGVTTYYGDLFLYRSGIFTDKEYTKALGKHIQKHFDNFGRLNLSVAQSSFDTWLDGYSSGIPNRKSSIYTEGCLLAFIADINIRRYTSNDFSLDDVMRKLYTDFAKNNKGYSEKDYKELIEKITGKNWNTFFEQYVYGVYPLDKLLNEALSYVGFELVTNPSKKFHEAFYGFKVEEEGKSTTISAIYPNSIAEKAGLKLRDKVVAINNREVTTNLDEWCNYFSEGLIELTIINDKRLRRVVFQKTQEVYYKSYYIKRIETPSKEQKENYEAWCKQTWNT